MANSELYDWTMFTDDEESLSLVGNLIRWGLADERYTDPTVFKARAITDSYELSSNEAMAIDGGATNTAGGSEPRMAFKARIMGENSPHSFLPNPCDPTWAADLNQTYRVISMHTTFLSPSTSKATSVTRGDVVLVKLERANQSYNLEYGTFEELVSVEDPAAGSDSECAALVSLFGAITHKPFTVGSQLGDGASTSTWDGKIQGLAPFVDGTATPPCPDSKRGFCENENCQGEAQFAKTGIPAPPDRFSEITPGNGNYRGATITSKAQLQLMRDTFGLKTIISLAADAAVRSTGGRGKCGIKDDSIGCAGQGGKKPCEQLWSESLGMEWYQVTMNKTKVPNAAEWRRIENSLRGGNTYFHCTHGVDRTGAIGVKWKLSQDSSLDHGDLFRYTKKFGGAWKMTTDYNGVTDAEALAHKDTGGLNWRLYNWMYKP